MKTLDFDLKKWQNVMENLLLNDNLSKTFENALTDILHNDIAEGRVIKTS
jgi:hypothetical protein